MFGANEGSIIGVLNGAKESKQEDRDHRLRFRQAAEGRRSPPASMAGAITQNPVGIGECVVDSAVKALKGEKLPKIIDTGFYWYDKTNIDDPKIAAVLYD